MSIARVIVIILATVILYVVGRSILHGSVLLTIIASLAVAIALEHVIHQNFPKITGGYSETSGGGDEKYRRLTRSDARIPPKAIIERKKRNANLSRAAVDGQKRFLETLGQMQAHVPRDLNDEYKRRKKQLKAMISTNEFNELAQGLVEYYRTFSDRSCTKVALNNYTDICWVVAVIDLVYNIPILEMLSDDVRKWVEKTYESSLSREGHAVECPSLPPNIHNIYAKLNPEMSPSRFQELGGFSIDLLYAICVAGGIVVPKTYHVRDFMNISFTGTPTDTADTINSDIDMALNNANDDNQAIAIEYIFDKPDLINLQSPWFRELAAACGSRPTKIVHGGMTRSSEGEHMMSFTVCYGNAASGTTRIMHRTWGKDALKDRDARKFAIDAVYIIAGKNAPETQDKIEGVPDVGGLDPDVDGLTNLEGDPDVDGLTNLEGDPDVDGLTNSEGQTNPDSMPIAEGIPIEVHPPTAADMEISETEVLDVNHGVVDVNIEPEHSITNPCIIS